MAKQKTYIAIDLKSFYASVECKERNRDPLTTNLVVADKSRTEKTICLAVSPSLKSYGIPGRPRLFEVVQKVRASGQSMIEAGIDDGDLVVVKKQVEAKEGDIVVALVDNQNTLKRYFRDDENKKIILHPENKKMKDIIVDECCIQGVACHIIKEL